MSFSISVERLVDRWQHDGLIDGETASRLHADLEKSAPRFSLGAVLASLGGLLLGAAVIMLVAANWQDMPRLMRIGLVFALIWAGYLGGAWRQSRGDRILPPALYIVGAASFGAGIALVGQMYHMSGDMQSAAILWAGGVLVSSFLLRAPVLAAFGAGVACFYLSTYMIDPAYGDLTYRWAGPLLALTGIITALFTRSRHAAHLWALFVIGWAVLIYSENESRAVLASMIIAGIALMMADAFAHESLQKLTRFAHPLASYGLLLALLALGILQMDRLFSSTAYGMLTNDVLCGILILALSVGALALCGRKNGGLRSIAYAAFSVEVLYLAFATVGSMIGTSGFFLTAGVLVLLLAAFVRRMEKRFGHAHANGGRP
ncbi:DUF2157 domain-containing protein [Falsochrobactrum sp. TDYN1]|uniref:DUF2157 domain-containing protein n=1 Tax=Falsochrobactrum tianjinense TaxID=2706015 RepID=A0A949PMT8_9HYPH|nr:DUF2157 domain-containing protein [Falsochrobactrum sp. TDYN1]MBV2142899.1 DUF2157 domain-containing protein [Falsochrobactrum sp. TDYN1]